MTSFSENTPMTPASATSGCAASTASTSAGGAIYSNNLIQHRLVKTHQSLTAITLPAVVFDKLLETAHDCQVAFCVTSHDVAGSVPPVRGEGLLVRFCIAGVASAPNAMRE